MQTKLSRIVQRYNYNQVQTNGTADIQREQVHKAILGHPEGVTDLEIVLYTGISRTSVTARRNELQDVTAVGIAKIQDEQGDRLNTLWGVERHPTISCRTLEKCGEEIERGTS